MVVGKPNCGKNFFIKAFTGFEIFSSKYPCMKERQSKRMKVECQVEKEKEELGEER